MIDVRSDHTPFKNSPPTSQWRQDEHVVGGAKLAAKEREGGEQIVLNVSRPPLHHRHQENITSFFCSPLPLIMIDFTWMHAALCVLNSSINQLKD